MKWGTEETEVWEEYRIPECDKGNGDGEVERGRERWGKGGPTKVSNGGEKEFLLGLLVLLLLERRNIGIQESERSKLPPIRSHGPMRCLPAPRCCRLIPYSTTQQLPLLMKNRGRGQRVMTLRPLQTEHVLSFSAAA